MKPFDALTHFATVRLPAEAANDDHGPPVAAVVVAPSPIPSGWDPFEVWRTRVRDAGRDGPGET